MDMFNIYDSWKKRKDGNLSTSGTTATVVLVRKNQIYYAHVGDSAAVIGRKKNNKYVAQVLTLDHKPGSDKEKTRIEQLGGIVVNTKGVSQIIWKRAVKQAPSTTPRYEYVPFLTISRALGDFWSYNTDIDQFIVSPNPDVDHIDLDINSNSNKFIILASDGLWNVMNAKEAVDHVYEYEQNNTKQRHKCSTFLVDKSLSIWRQKRASADNISVIVVFLDDEFRKEDDDNESFTSSTADTIIIGNSEETEPISSQENITSVPFPLIGQLALPTSTSPAIRALIKPSSSSPEYTSISGLSTCEETSTGTDIKKTTRCKRKIPVTVASSKVAKKNTP